MIPNLRTLNAVVWHVNYTGLFGGFWVLEADSTQPTLILNSAVLECRHHEHELTCLAVCCCCWLVIVFVCCCHGGGPTQGLYVMGELSTKEVHSLKNFLGA